MGSEPPIEVVSATQSKDALERISNRYPIAIFQTKHHASVAAQAFQHRAIELKRAALDKIPFESTLFSFANPRFSVIPDCELAT